MYGVYDNLYSKAHLSAILVTSILLSVQCYNSVLYFYIRAIVLEALEKTPKSTKG